MVLRGVFLRPPRRGHPNPEPRTLTAFTNPHAAGRDFMTARDGRRAEKVLVDGAREKVEEIGELSREMDEWSLFDEVGDMRGARRELGRSGGARGWDDGAR